MSIRFNADEVFEMAERIESNGAAFYRAGGARVADGPVRALLLELAAWEDKHLALFAGLRRELLKADRQTQTFDPNNEAVLYLQALADSAVFKREESPAQALGPQPTARRVLEAALQREKDAIVFFAGMAEIVPPHLGKDKVGDILKEEMRHVTIITRQLANAG
jgi:rubrerythrin